jgi:flagellar biosynthesis/type III secretory pathway protein FliH
MSAFRLQTFVPGLGAARAREEERDRALQSEREDAFREGYVAGQAAATEAHLDDQTRLTAQLVEALNDARLTNEAARLHVASSLAPVIEALCDAIAPALAEAGIAAEAARLVAYALEAAPDAQPRLRCAPELAPRLEAIFSERGLAARIELAPELLPREAQVMWEQGYDHLDLDACIAQVRDCLALHLKPLKESQDDDPRRFG